MILQVSLESKPIGNCNGNSGNNQRIHLSRRSGRFLFDTLLRRPGDAISFLDRRIVSELIAETKFDCVDRDGNPFVATVQIGDPTTREDKFGRTEFQFSISFDPFFAKRLQGGQDNFTAMCFSIELVRKALRVFVAHGGTVFMHGTRSPIDINDPYFTPICGIIGRKFINGDPAPGSPWL